MKEIKPGDYFEKCVQNEWPFILACSIKADFRELKRLNKQAANKLLKELKNAMS